ncbi:hypothetical protein MTOK_06420 [Mycolicibacterium tokaiense]|nr:hypothetical protein MTOK_06420 [Mycolicibacterium tokaiense]
MLNWEQHFYIHGQVKENQPIDVKQSNDVAAPSRHETPIEDVQDLINFLTKQVSRYDSYRRNEVFVQIKDAPGVVAYAQVVDDNFILDIEPRNQIGYHEE